MLLANYKNYTCVKSSSSLYPSGYSLSKLMSGVHVLNQKIFTAIASANRCLDGYEFDGVNFVCYKSTVIGCDLSKNLNFNGSCVFPCPVLSSITSERVCQPCGDSQVLLNNTCIDFCPSNTILLSNRTCSASRDYCPIIFNNTCMYNCPPKNYQCGSSCIECSKNEYFLLNSRTCTSSCPDNYKSSVINGINICYNCTLNNQYYDNSTLSCVSQCPPNFIGSSILGECIFIANVILSNNALSSSCPSGYFINLNTRQCEHCPNLYDKGQCVIIALLLSFLIYKIKHTTQAW